MNHGAAAALLDDAEPDRAATLAKDAAVAAADVSAALELAASAGPLLPLPGEGSTALRWALLAAVAEQDLTVARVLEPHTDALAILAEAGIEPSPGTWGVFAAESPGHRLSAGPALSGTKPWCSLADRLDRALVTAHVAGGRRLFAVDLRHPGVRVHPADGWTARGLRDVTSVAVDFHDVPATPVGDVDWYLTRDGFAWGGIGVAACWFGGAYALYRTLRDVTVRRTDDITRMHLGAVDTAMCAAASVLRSAAIAVDGGRARRADGALLALRVRAVVAEAVETALTHTAQALGPAPLAFDEEHARRVADLSLYVRQHHAARDLAQLGAAISEAGAR